MQELQSFCIRGKCVNIVEEIAFSWDKVAVQLGLTTATINKVKKNNANVPDPNGSACFEMLQDWLEGDYVATWRLLIGAIKCVSVLTTLAVDIELALK